MTRYLFSPDLILSAPTPPDVQLAPNAAFTLWSEAVGGTQYMDCTAPDGVTPLITDGTGAYLADGNGQRPALRGPDEVVVMWCDTGTSVRFAMISPDKAREVLSGGAVSDQHIRDIMGALVISAGGAYDGTNVTFPAGAGVGTGGVTDHGALSGLADDDHPQYLNAARGDVRYYTQAQVTSAISAANTTASATDRNRANHSGTQLAASISDFTAAVRAIVGVPTIVVRTAAQGVPTAAQAAAAGYPDGALIVVDPA